jgi:hypothetical protein
MCPRTANILRLMLALPEAKWEDKRQSGIPDHAAIVDGNWNFNSNDALEGQTHTPKDMGICHK